MLRERLAATALSAFLPLGAGLALGLITGCGGAQPDSPPAAQPPTDVEEDGERPGEAGDGPADDAGEAPADTGEVEPVAEAEPPDPWGPITPENKAILWAGDEEERISTPEHYIQTNERRHDVWFPYIEDLGGAYVGVAADQNYTLIAVAKSEYVFLMDLDWRVTELHRVYEVLIEATEDPAELVRLWHEDNIESTKALIEDALRDELDEDQLRKTMMSWRSGRETVYRHLERVHARTQDGQPTTWLSNPEYYAHIRKLYLNDRVRMLVGDLTGPTSMQTIAKAASDLGVPVRLLYLSNAEEYYKYTPQYRQNITGLPTEPGSIVLRTIYSKKWVHADSLWNYQVQPIADYKTRLEDPKNGRRTLMLNRAEKDGVLEKNVDPPGGLSRIDIESLPGWGDDAAAPAPAGDAG